VTLIRSYFPFACCSQLTAVYGVRLHRSRPFGRLICWMNKAGRLFVSAAKLLLWRRK